MSKQEKQSNFVNHMVGVLIDRHADKLQSVIAPVDEGRILLTAENKELVAAAEKMEKASNLADAAIAAHNDAMREFTFKFGEEADALVSAASAKRIEAINQAQQAFEFRVRKAIGQIELVGGEAAFQTLEDCRNEINDL